MRSIYEKSCLVEVWLGEPDGNSRRAFEQTRKLHCRMMDASGLDALLAQGVLSAQEGLDFSTSPDRQG